EEGEPALADHWQDVCAAFHDEDAHHLYVRPEQGLADLERASIRLSAISADQPFEFRAQAADTGARSLKEAETELEKLARSTYTTVVTWPRRGEGERAAYNLARVRAKWLGEEGEADIRFAEARLRDGFTAAGRSAPRDRRGAERCGPSPTCAPATSSCTRITASRASRASRPRRSQAS